MVQMMKWKNTFGLIKDDYHRISKNGGINIFFNAIFNHSFSITFWFRIATYLNEKKGLRYKIPLFFVKVIYFFNQRATGIQLPIGTRIGGGLKFFHYNCVVIAYSTVMGKNCSIHHGVTIGRVFAGKKAGTPTIGDNVVVFPGANIVGKVSIGNNVVIGANAVVVDDVPANCVVTGVPAKIVSNDSSKCFEGVWKEWFLY